MTNPMGEKPADEGIEKEQSADKQESLPGVSFGDLMENQSRGAKAESEALRSARDAQDASSKLDLSAFVKSTYLYSLGQRPQFQIRKSEFLHEFDKPAQEIRPLVDQFLKDTPNRDDSSLTPAEKNELIQTRDSLSRFTSAEDALSTALHLARLYQHLRYLEEAKKATDLSLGIDPENHLGTELFKELERLHPPDIAVCPPAATSPALLTKSNLRKCIQNLSGGRVIVLGDLLIDELLEGKPERISREAPVLILEHVDTELNLGGAANAAHNVAALGGVCHAIGVTGRDEYHQKLARLFDKVGITHSLVQDSTRPTTVKTRILSKSHALSQQLLRLDRICHDTVSPLVEGLLVDKLNQVAPQYKAIVVSDYRGGLITDDIIRACKAIAARHNVMVIVDAQDHFERFQDVLLMTPNQPDTEKMVGFAISDKATLARAGEELLVATGVKALLITRGGDGMALFQPGKDMVELPAFNRSEVFDVTGAGDTVVATMALSLVTGCSFVEAMALGNLAAGIVVKKQGTAVTSQQEMLEHLELVQLSE